jgi:DNA repair protein RadA/Sms
MAEYEIYAATVGGIAATEPAADLAIALALASAARGTALPPTVCAIGEVSLSGDVRLVPGLDRRLAEAARLGMTTALVPGGYRDPPPAGIVTRPVATIGAAVSAAGAVAATAQLGGR